MLTVSHAQQVDTVMRSDLIWTQLMTIRSVKLDFGVLVEQQNQIQLTAPQDKYVNLACTVLLVQLFKKCVLMAHMNLEKVTQTLLVKHAQLDGTVLTMEPMEQSIQWYVQLTSIVQQDHQLEQLTVLMVVTIQQNLVLKLQISVLNVL